MPRHALDERSELAASLRAAGPHAPTLCGDWDTSQLAAHLVRRERSLVEVLGRIPLPRAQALALRHLDRYVAARPYEQLVATLEGGAPRWSPFALPAVRERVNLLEYLVHHEDVRRAGEGWLPRVVAPERQQAVWAVLRLTARLTLRSVRLPVRLSWPGSGEVGVGHGRPRVTISGDPVELALVAFGRQAVAQVDYDGPAADVERVRTATIAV